MKTIENELIPVYENEKGNKLVDGRELHEFLKVQQDFSDWIKKQLDSVDSKEGKTHSLLKGSANNGGGVKIDYTLTIQIAKEICMVAGVAPRANEETKRLSKQARQYFIALEEKYKQDEISNLEKLKLEQQGLKFAVELLNPSKASSVKMLKTLYESQGLSTIYLPIYVDEEEGHSLTELLKKFKISMSAVKFNKLLVEKGYVTEESRPSTNKNGFKKYKKLTDIGLEYGKNKISTYGTEKETVPLYYESKFQKLVDIVLN